MIKPKVTIIECSEYDKELVKKAVEKAINNIGGIKKFVNKGQRVCLKPNLLKPAKTKDSITTHPFVAQAVADIVESENAHHIFIDSPGGPFSNGAMFKKTYLKCGFDLENYNFNFDAKEINISNPEGIIVKRLDVLSAVLECDSIINIPKIKTHSLTTITCAVKNMFGTISGMNKIAYHSKLKNVNNFSMMLIDVAKRMKPCLTVVDGIWGMEGNGPAAGTPKKVGVIIAGDDVFAVDFVVCHLIGLEPKQVPYLRIAMEKDLCVKNFNDIEIISDVELDKFGVKFKLPDSLGKTNGKSNWKLFYKFAIKFLSMFQNTFVDRPKIQKNCIGCGICAKSCPEKAIRIVDKKAIINYSKCIRCYCCHEMCQHHAIKLR